MPLRPRNRQRQFAWFIIDNRLWWDDEGWLFWFRTPLFGITIQKNWIDWLYIDMLKTSIDFGLICQQMADEGGKMYLLNWEKVLSRKPMESLNVAKSNT